MFVFVVCGISLTSGQLINVLFVCGGSLWSGQLFMGSFQTELINELFPDCLKVMLFGRLFYAAGVVTVSMSSR